MILLIIVLVLVFGVGGGAWGNGRWGPSGGAGVGLGTVLIILLIVYLAADPLNGRSFNERNGNYCLFWPSSVRHRAFLRLLCPRANPPSWRTNGT